MTHSSEFQTVFPNLYNLRHHPQTFAWNLLLGLERFFIRFFRFAAVLLIIYTLIAASPDGCVEGIKLYTYENFETIIAAWKVWRNALLFLLFLELGVTLPICIGYFLKERYFKVARHLLSWFWTYLLIIFSFAITGFIFDMLYLAKYIHLGLFNLDSSLVTGCWYKL
jgi:hypothetical protein